MCTRAHTKNVYIHACHVNISREFLAALAAHYSRSNSPQKGGNTMVMKKKKAAKRKPAKKAAKRKPAKKRKAAKKKKR